MQGLNLTFVVYRQKTEGKTMNSGCCCEVEEICPLPGYYAAYSYNSSPTFRDDPSGPTFKCQEIQEKFADP